MKSTNVWPDIELSGLEYKWNIRIGVLQCTYDFLSQLQFETGFLILGF